MNDPAAFLAQANYDSHPSFKFATPGDEISGRIVSEPRVVETDDLNGESSTKLVLDVDTGEEIFSVWCGAGKRITRALAEAVKAAGATGPALGGRVTIRFTGEGEQKRAGFARPKLFAAKYEPPASADLSDFVTG